MTGTPRTMTETPDLGSALQRLRVTGAIFLRAEYTEGWQWLSLGQETAGLLHPGAERLILFHVIASGRCWISVDGGERHWAETGDVIVLPYGHQHTMGGVEEAECIDILTIVPPMPWTEFPILRCGEGGAQTDVVCGYLHCEDPLFDPAMQVFPPVFVVRPTGPAVEWVKASVEYALAANPGPDKPAPPMATRIPELLLTEVLRIHLSTAPAANQGLVAALRDDVVAPVLALLHGEPDKKWTVAELASRTAVSRSVLDERFRRVLGQSPIRYLTDWRMHIAAELLATTELSVAAIARRAGYEAEEAFSRAFKRYHGLSPAHWRDHGSRS